MGCRVGAGSPGVSQRALRARSKAAPNGSQLSGRVARRLFAPKGCAEQRVSIRACDLEDGALRWWALLLRVPCGESCVGTCRDLANRLACGLGPQLTGAPCAGCTSQRGQELWVDASTPTSPVPQTASAGSHDSGPPRRGTTLGLVPNTRPHRYLRYRSSAAISSRSTILLISSVCPSPCIAAGPGRAAPCRSSSRLSRILFLNSCASMIPSF
jgi:hypothetical protein